MNRRDNMHPDKIRSDRPEMKIALLDGERDSFLLPHSVELSGERVR